MEQSKSLQERLVELLQSQAAADRRKAIRFASIYGRRVWAENMPLQSVAPVLVAMFLRESIKDFGELAPVLRMAGRLLGTLVRTETTVAVEGLLGVPGWQKIFEAAQPALYTAYIRQIDDSVTVGEAVAAALLSRQSHPELTDQEALELFHFAVDHYDPGEWTSRAIASFDALMASAEPDWLRSSPRYPGLLCSWLSAWLDLDPRQDSNNYFLDTRRPQIGRWLSRHLGDLVDPELARKILQTALDEMQDLERSIPGLVRAAFRIAPAPLVERLKRIWREVDGFHSAHFRARGALLVVGSELVPHLCAELAYEVAKEWSSEDEKGQPRFKVRKILARWNLDPGAVRNQIYVRANVWVTLMRAVQHRSPDGSLEAVAWSGRLGAFARKHPDAWAEMLPMILTRPEGMLPLVQATTFVAADRSSRVVDVLRASRRLHDEPVLRDRAEGLLSLLGSTESLPSGSATLMQTLVQFVDGPGAAPHPLELRSGTWLGSRDLEDKLRDGVNRAAKKFQRDLPIQIGGDEEPLTRELLLDIVHEMERLDLLLRAVRRSARRPRIVTAYRQLTKHEENPLGCDVALRVRVDVPGWMKLDSVEFVQVKKPLRNRRGNAPPYGEHWSIEVEPQLTNIINLSQTSAYWLITPDGAVDVVPARLLRGLIDGARKTSASVTLHQYQTRSMRISLASFLVDLVTGVWLGSSSPVARRVAEGKDPTNRPRHLFEIKVHMG